MSTDGGRRPFFSRTQNAGGRWRSSKSSGAVTTVCRTTTKATAGQDNDSVQCLESPHPPPLFLATPGDLSCVCDTVTSPIARAALGIRIFFAKMRARGWPVP